jgi:hypothetical protein
LLGSDTTHTNNTLLIDVTGLKVTKFACREEGPMLFRKHSRLIDVTRLKDTKFACREEGPMLFRKYTDVTRLKVTKFACREEGPMLFRRHSRDALKGSFAARPWLTQPIVVKNT